jgi:hypothetical protein
VEVGVEVDQQQVAVAVVVYYTDLVLHSVLQLHLQL